MYTGLAFFARKFSCSCVAHPAFILVSCRFVLTYATVESTCWRQVEYSCELGKPVVTIADARREGAFHDPPPIAGPNSNLPDGQPSALPAVEASPLQIRGAKCVYFVPPLKPNPNPEP